MLNRSVSFFWSLPTWVYITSITLIAWTLRVYDLATLPPGVDRDTATNGVYSLYILLENWRPLFYRIGAPEPLIVYLQAASLGLFGIGIFQLRWVTAIVGTLTIPALFVFTRAVKIESRVALIAAAGLALNIEHFHLSRLGLRAIFIPLVEMLLLFWFWRGWQSGRARDFLIAGIALGT
ncbi:MAG: glycosyltransferase family 39 protein, partial [Chloroflexi bacterium]|nr:glycosyltransferase family 39 protein [Chloroflexota bacterium]